MEALLAIDGSAWVAIGIWAGLWLTMVLTGLVLVRREKQRGGPY